MKKTHMIGTIGLLAATASKSSTMTDLFGKNLPAEGNLNYLDIGSKKRKPKNLNTFKGKKR